MLRVVWLFLLRVAVSDGLNIGRFLVIASVLLPVVAMLLICAFGLGNIGLSTLHLVCLFWIVVVLLSHILLSFVDSLR